MPDRVRPAPEVLEPQSADRLLGIGLDLPGALDVCYGAGPQEPARVAGVVTTALEQYGFGDVRVVADERGPAVSVRRT
ncbi:hypothetical protein I4I73_02200 [Pseudonocardia sp. KRD-184]|uniref:hypothetical protein n=1 Tax=Pseudonocardia oceani TaxID=2792013 RepID=UPI001C4A6229|nr:hypothetical protein [Pseudonocardia oceani]MBW0094810.1 hypothetical protein [Pseudonocardia oceani]MBW0107588.1 hypothetical protein [Pseudonocardia oceani]MBW0121029.1 hypothetical protein [Pseudonocardia oceani]